MHSTLARIGLRIPLLYLLRDGVSSRPKPGEAIISLFIRVCRFTQMSRPGQLNGPAGKARFIRIFCPVAVAVLELEPRDGQRRLRHKGPGLDERMLVLAGCSSRQAVIFISNAVAVIVRAFIIRPVIAQGKGE